MNKNIPRPITQVVLTTRNIQVIKPCELNYQKAPILVAISHRNQPEELAKALNSIKLQSIFQRNLVQVVVLDDNSNHDSIKHLKKVAGMPFVTILQANCGSAAHARNALLDWADEQNHIRWVARLDADDQLATSDSLSRLVEVAEKKGVSIAIGGNQVTQLDNILKRVNRPCRKWLKHPALFVKYVVSFCHGQEKHELPSCNLLLKNRAGYRYPNIKSAEDHWLVATLLLLSPEKVAIEVDSIYSIYSLNGEVTKSNLENQSWADSRRKLAYVIQAVYEIQIKKKMLLGFGMEGIVYENKGNTIKVFHPWGMTDSEALRLNKLLVNSHAPIPKGTMQKQRDQWYFISSVTDYKPVGNRISVQQIKVFLKACYQAEIAPANIKRDNLMLHPNGSLHYIDIGKDILARSASYFLDLSARLYGIGVLGYSDNELARRKSPKKQEQNLSALDGFSNFYLDLMTDLHLLKFPFTSKRLAGSTNENTTLLIKSCAQDVEGFYEQICHIVTQLEYPQKFRRKLLLIDSYPGPFLRQYAIPNLDKLIQQAKKLHQEGVIDGIIIAPSDPETIRDTYMKWFGRSDIISTHTTKNAPLYNQIWAFDQVNTQFVLQCDSDVLIGRKSWQHDYLHDMLNELQKSEVQSVGFNIPKTTNTFLKYFGVPGQFAPEVRFGLIDLKKFNLQLPITNHFEDDKFVLTWHRSMQQHELKTGYFKAVRGGDPSSFYVHPKNSDKLALKSGVIRDLISQGISPEKQRESFDLVPQATWEYPSRSEDVVFLLKGRNTPHQKLQRCLNSLIQQTVQTFGVIIIDDASSLSHSGVYPRLLTKLKPRVTLIRNTTHLGRIPNFIQAITSICNNPESLIVVLDQDDFLMDKNVVKKLKIAKRQGHDVIQMPMFRPNKPVKLYQPDYTQSRSKKGANVWAHLRAFSKECFDKIPKEHFKRLSGEWFDSVTDYVTMLPLVELAKNPTFIDTGYAYWHERDEYSVEYKAYQSNLLTEIFEKPTLLKEKETNTPEH